MAKFPFFAWVRDVRDATREVQRDIDRTDTWPRYYLMSIVVAVGGIILGALDGSYGIVALAIVMLALSVHKFRQKRAIQRRRD